MLDNQTKPQTLQTDLCKGRRMQKVLQGYYKLTTHTNHKNIPKTYKNGRNKTPKLKIIPFN